MGNQQAVKLLAGPPYAAGELLKGDNERAAKPRAPVDYPVHLFMLAAVSVPLTSSNINGALIGVN